MQVTWALEGSAKLSFKFIVAGPPASSWSRTRPHVFFKNSFSPEKEAQRVRAHKLKLKCNRLVVQERDSNLFVACGMPLLRFLCGLRAWAKGLDEGVSHVLAVQLRGIRCE